MKNLILKSTITLFLISTGFLFLNAQAFINNGPPVPSGPYCAGANITVSYTAGAGAWNPGNIFTLELSDPTGSFGSPTDIGNVVSTFSGNVSGIIPLNAINGSNYYVRVVSTNPVVVGSPYPIGTIFALPIVGCSVTPNDTVCYGDVITLTGSGSNSYAYSGGVTDASPFPVYDTLMYTFTGTDTNGCTNTDSVLIVVNPLPNLVVSGDIYTCVVGFDTLTVSGADSYVWELGSIPGDTIIVNPANSTTYTVTGTIAATGCMNSSNINIWISTPGGIYGHVSYSGGDVIHGFAVLQPYQAINTSFDTTDVVSLDASGNYYFSNVLPGDYLIKIFASPFAYPTLVPTYYGDHWAWDSAFVYTQGCSTNEMGVDIVMIEQTGSGGGIGLLHGQIFEGPGFGRAPGGPINGVDVKLGVAGSSSIVASATTDAAGAYTFSSVDFGTYTVYADIPGLGRDSSYTITVDASNNLFLNLNYTVDSVSIYILPNLGVQNTSTVDNKFNIYPNPVMGNSTIEYSLNNDANVKLDVYDVVGVKVQSLINIEQESGAYQINFNPRNINLKAGIYFISLSINGKTNTMRIVTLE